MLLWKAKTYDVTPAKPVLSEVEGAGVQSEKLDSRWSLSRTRCGAGMTNMDTYVRHPALRLAPDRPHRRTSNRRTVSATGTSQTGLGI